ncbi:hypothetical protein Tco_1072243 [Tanacetum coccineum]
MSNLQKGHWEAVKWLLCYLKVGGTTVIWMPRLQKCFAMGTKEAEYMAVAMAGKELICFNNFLEELEKSKAKSVMYCDNLLKNMVFNSPVKYIKIRCQYI